MPSKSKPKPIASLADLTPDSTNPNLGTPRGEAVILASLQKLGAGRSILVDREGRIIAGNKTAEQAMVAGLEDVIVVPSDGTKLVVVQREDLDLSADEQARLLSIADNRAAEVGLAWDLDVLAEVGHPAALDWLWSEGELDVIFNAAPPSLDDLADEYGEPDASDLWPEIRLRLPPATYDRYQELAAQVDAEHDYERFAALLDAVDPDVL